MQGGDAHRQIQLTIEFKNVPRGGKIYHIIGLQTSMHTGRTNGRKQTTTNGTGKSLMLQTTR